MQLERGLELQRRLLELAGIEELGGHSAWIDGDWKLHRIEGKNAQVTWELYNLATDPAEEKNVVDDESQRAASMRSALEDWLKSVVRSLNGEDYAN